MTLRTLRRTPKSVLLKVLSAILFLEGILIFFGAVVWRPPPFKELDTQKLEREVEKTEAFEVLEQEFPKADPPLVLDRLGASRAELLANGRDFLEINFSLNKISKYEKGQMVAEAPILAKGDPQGWGGTPAGLYAVRSKNERSFSNISQVYMPYAVHFYGKYLFHGEPYYPWGEKTDSGVSGGCIQVKDDLAQKMYGLVKQGTPLLMIDKENDGYQYGKAKVWPLPNVSAASYLIADLDSGFVFAQRNSRDIHPIASLTKLMNALVVVENVDLRKSVRITREMLEVYGRTEGLIEGERYRVVELLYPLLISSSNQAAEALAGFLGRDRTLQLMNEKAKAIFMEDTFFTDPSGLDEGNVSTAQDLFYLARYIRNNRPPIWEITKGKEVRSFGEVRFSVEKLWNKNMFVPDPSFVGGKTGYTIPSKHTGIFLFHLLANDGATRTIAFILVGSQDPKLDTQRLYAWLSRSYELFPTYTFIPGGGAPGVPSPSLSREGGERV